ncbi:MAG: hypothetical protein WBN23_00205 [Woeseia sp.]
MFKPVILYSPEYATEGGPPQARHPLAFCEYAPPAQIRLQKKCESSRAAAGRHRASCGVEATAINGYFSKVYVAGRLAWLPLSDARFGAPLRAGPGQPEFAQISGGEPRRSGKKKAGQCPASVASAFRHQSSSRKLLSWSERVG